MLSEDEKKARAKEATKKWRAANKEKYTETHRKWRDQNPQNGIDSATKWRNKNIDRCRQSSKERLLMSKKDIKIWAMSKTSRVKARCKKKGIPFNITYMDVLRCVPDDMVCPITNTVMCIDGSRGKRNSASIDRIKPNLGYVVGNIAIISFQANCIKQDCIDPELFRRMANWIEDRIKL